MSEPLNDEEFKRIKLTEGHGLSRQAILGLIATVELRTNVAKDIIQSMGKQKKELKEENAKLRKPSKNDRRQHDLNYPAQAPERRGR